MHFQASTNRSSPKHGRRTARRILAGLSLFCVLAGADAGGCGGAGGGPLGGGSCSDNGDSCKNDSTVVRWKSQCSSNQTSQAPCYCSAAATDDCFLRHGCYKEAGASTSVTQSSLQSMKAQMISAAGDLGTRCGL